jgi:hypothetical protein
VNNGVEEYLPAHSGVDKWTICEFGNHISNELSDFNFELLGTSIEWIVADGM